MTQEEITKGIVNLHTKVTVCEDSLYSKDLNYIKRNLRESLVDYLIENEENLPVSVREEVELDAKFKTIHLEAVLIDRKVLSELLKSYSFTMGSSYGFRDKV